MAGSTEVGGDLGGSGGLVGAEAASPQAPRRGGSWGLDAGRAQAPVAGADTREPAPSQGAVQKMPLLAGGGGRGADRGCGRCSVPTDEAGLAASGLT